MTELDCSSLFQPKKIKTKKASQGTAVLKHKATEAHEDELAQGAFQESYHFPERYGLSWAQFEVKSVPKNTPGNAKPAAEQPTMDRHSSDGRDDSRFSQDVQGFETRTRFTHDDAWGPHDRCYHSSRRLMGSDDCGRIARSDAS